MAQVRQSELGGLGFFATKAYAEGDVILEEKPLIILAPSNEDEDKCIIDEYFGNKKQPASSSGKNKGNHCTLWGTIDPPPDIPKEAHGRFRSMVQAGLVFESEKKKNTENANWKELEDDLFQLYHPIVGNKGTNDQELSAENEVVDLAQHACDYIRKHKKQSISDDESLKKIMLIWACNSFEGGRVYAQTSRVNHSCNPNAIIKVGSESQLQKAAAASTEGKIPPNRNECAQLVVAAAPIAEGDEVTISYLGLLLYSDTSTRRDILKRQKMFVCGCPRCAGATMDKASLIPCPSCHPRQEPQGILDEDVQYDDDQTVSYVTMESSCDQCHSTPNASEKSEKQMKKLQKVMSNVANKVSSYLEDHHEALSTRSRSYSKTVNDDGGGSNDAIEPNEELLEEHLSLASTVMGAKHWTTNLLMLLHLDQRLSAMSQAMLTTQELPEMEDIAEAIDSLERVLRFVDGLDLNLHHGHVLADVVIGVARTLVSLGDEKSQKYAADWLDKLGDYVNLFESEGRQKVVETLKESWKRHGSDDSSEPLKKKAKASK